MRRCLIGIAALLATTVALAACGGGDDPAPPEPSPVGADTTPPPEPDPEPPAPEPPPEPPPPADPDPPAEPAALTKDEYITEADIICAELDVRTEALGEPETFEEIAAWAAQLGELADDGLARLAALEPPAEDREGADTTMALLAEQAELIPALQLAAESADDEQVTAVVTRVAELAAEADGVAQAYGFTQCGVEDTSEQVDGGAAPGQDQGDLVLNYVPSENEATQSTIDVMRESELLDLLVEGVNDTLALPRDINIFVQEEISGPAYYPDVNEIIMPPEFTDFVFSVFGNSGYVDSADDARDLTLATMAFVFVHEIGHALTNQLELPITGREEDAADQLATVIVTSAGEGAGGIALATAVLHALFTEDRTQFEAADFWDEHSLDEQRFFNIACWVYGSDPAQYGDAVLDTGLGEDRLVRCEDEWMQLSNSWEALLAPHVKG